MHYHTADHRVEERGQETAGSIDESMPVVFASQLPPPRRSVRTVRLCMTSLMMVLLSAGTARAQLPSPDVSGGSMSPAEARQQQETLGKIHDRMETVNKSLDEDRGRQDALGRDLQDTETAITRLNAGLNRIEAQINSQQQAVELTRQRQAAVRQKMESERGALRAQVRAAYLMGRQQQTKMLLNQEDPARLGRVLTYYDYMNRSHIRQIEGVRSQLKHLQDLEATLRGQLDNLIKLQDGRRDSIDRLKTNRDVRRATLDRIHAHITDQNRELAQLRDSESRVAQLVTSMQQALADTPLDLAGDRPFPKLKGRLLWPVHGNLLAGFGQLKAGGRLAWHGIWIASPAATPVRVIARGRVVYVGMLHHYGLIVVVEHGNNYFSLYGHNQNASVSVGQTLDAGQIVALTGDTGGYDQTGVYLEIRNGEDPVNPLQWLRR